MNSIVTTIKTASRTISFQLSSGLILPLAWSEGLPAAVQGYVLPHTLLRVVFQRGEELRLLHRLRDSGVVCEQMSGDVSVVPLCLDEALDDGGAALADLRDAPMTSHRLALLGTVARSPSTPGPDARPASAPPTARSGRRSSRAAPREAAWRGGRSASGSRRTSRREACSRPFLCMNRTRKTHFTHICR